MCRIRTYIWDVYTRSRCSEKRYIRVNDTNSMLETIYSKTTRVNTDWGKTLSWKLWCEFDSNEIDRCLIECKQRGIEREDQLNMSTQWKIRHSKLLTNQISKSNCQMKVDTWNRNVKINSYWWKYRTEKSP